MSTVITVSRWNIYQLTQKLRQGHATQEGDRRLEVRLHGSRSSVTRGYELEMEWRRLGNPLGAGERRSEGLLQLLVLLARPWASHKLHSGRQDKWLGLK